MAPELLTDGRIDVDALARTIASDEHGAVATFLGTARRHSNGKEVRLLRYEAYLPMAEKVLREIVASAQTKWPETRVVAQHRLGEVPLGEASIAVVAASAHRAEAFAACRWVVDAIKADVPIWKQELFTDGSAWVGDPDSFRGNSAAISARGAPTRARDGGAK